MKKAFSSPTKILAITFVILLLISVLTAAVNTVGFTVKIRRVNQIMDNGANYSALAYIPKSVNNQNPAPGVILVHGNSTNAIQQSSHAIELARRGYVVISMDIAGRGQSELGEGLVDAELTPSLIVWINYMLDSPIVDSDQIIFSSHSMGGMLCGMAIKMMPGVIDTWVNNGTMLWADFEEYNLGLFGGAYEFRTGNDVKEAFGPFIGMDPADVEYGKIYEVEGLKFQCNASNRIHSAVYWNSDSVQQLCDFLHETNPTGTYIPGSNQIWWIHSALGMLGMAAIIAFMLALVNALANTEFFSIVRQPLPRAFEFSKGGFAISAVIAVLVVFLGYGPFTQLYKFLLPSTSTMFPTVLANGMVTFVLAVAVISLILGIPFFARTKKQNAVLAEYGVTTAGNSRLSWTLIWKSGLIALISVFVVYLWLKIMEDLSGADFVCGCMGLQSITPLRLRIAIPYIVLYFISFLVSGFVHNVERRLPSTGNKTKDDCIAFFVNVAIGTLGMLLYVVVTLVYDKTTLGANNTIGFMNVGLHTIFAYGLIWFMAVTSAVSTVCYRITGSIWTGAFVNALYAGCTLLTVVPMTAIVR